MINEEKVSVLDSQVVHSEQQQLKGKERSFNPQRKSFNGNNNSHDRGPRKDGFRNNNNSYGNGREEFKSETLEVRRVAKTTTGGKRLSFSALVVIGNGEGSIGIGKGKDKEVSGAINKALNDAHKHIIRIARHKTTIVHDVMGKFGATSILFKKAKTGTGCISCNVIKSIMNLAGVENLVAKVFGSSNLRNVVHAMLNGISKLESPKSIAMRRGKPIESILGSIHKGRIKMHHKSIIEEEETVEI